MSAPWLKFFPTDWRADPALRMCSVGARGLWMEMLCVMHEAEPRGSLRINGKAVTDRQLASLAGCPDISELMVELEEAGVFSREGDGTIYSRRMVRDAEKAEEDKANGKRGGNPQLKGGVNPQDKAQKPEAIIHSKEEPIGSSKKRSTTLPEDFAPDLNWAVAQGLSFSEAQTEAAQFKDFWSTKSGKDALKADWPAAWRMWVRNYLKRKATSPPHHRGRRNFVDAALDRINGTNGSEGVFGNNGDAQRLSSGSGQPGPDDGNLRGGIAGRYITSGH